MIIICRLLQLFGDWNMWEMRRVHVFGPGPANCQLVLCFRGQAAAERVTANLKTLWKTEVYLRGEGCMEHDGKKS